ncbi:bacterial membrane flanked domain protein [bacterium BMS3Bbin02]|nr:bacterial membrane flanked domain protein [bacterium BMS3Bbin02]
MWDAPGFETLPTKALLVSRVRGAFMLLIIIAVLAAADLVIRQFVEPAFPPLVLPGLIALAAFAVGWMWTHLVWRALGWRLDDRTFETRSGVYWKTWKGIPRDRVQFVEVVSGPLQRHYGLATLVVRTAGVYTPAVSVKDLVADVAERLRAELSPESPGGVLGNHATEPGL